MSAGFGIAASLGIGIGDHITRGAAERGGLRQTLAAVFLVGIGVSTIGALAFGSQWLAADMLLGAATGVLVFLALSSLYLGYASASAGIVGPPAAVISSAVLRPSSSRMSQMTSFAPSWANILATAAPIPLAPPLIKATLFSI